MFMGYYKDEEETQAVGIREPGGWLKSGDIGDVLTVTPHFYSLSLLTHIPHLYSSLMLLSHTPLSYSSLTLPLKCYPQ